MLSSVAWWQPVLLHLLCAMVKQSEPFALRLENLGLVAVLSVMVLRHDKLGVLVRIGMR